VASAAGVCLLPGPSSSSIEEGLLERTCSACTRRRAGGGGAAAAAARQGVDVLLGAVARATRELVEARVSLRPAGCAGRPSPTGRRSRSKSCRRAAESPRSVSWTERCPPSVSLKSWRTSAAFIIVWASALLYAGTRPGPSPKVARHEDEVHAIQGGTQDREWHELDQKPEPAAA